MGDSFFNRVMSLPTTPIKFVDPRAVDKRPAPEPTAKRHSKYSMNIFKVVLEADAGGDPHSHEKFYEEHLADLSEPELEALKKRVLLLRDRCLHGSEEHVSLTRAQSFIEAAVDKRLGISEQHTAKLHQMIRNKLDQFEPIDIRKSSEGQLVVVIAQAATMSLDQFVRTHFGDIIAEFERLLRKKKVVRKKNDRGGIHFVVDALLGIVKR